MICYRLLFSAFLLVLAGVAPAQQPADPAPPPPPAQTAAQPATGVDPGLFFETVSVNVVNVDVYVTDRSGNRVRGLKKEDFELFEDRKQVAITNFYAIDSGAEVVPPPAPGEPPSLPRQPETPADPGRRFRLN